MSLTRSGATKKIVVAPYASLLTALRIILLRLVASFFFGRSTTSLSATPCRSAPRYLLVFLLRLVAPLLMARGGASLVANSLISINKKQQVQMLDVLV